MDGGNYVSVLPSRRSENSSRIDFITIMKFARK
jgi:hypothetical protein